jgi:pimeloyl-ACP methyl ester carboxylesterase
LARVKVAGEDIFYVERSTGEAEGDLVFIHGAGGTHRHWGYQLQGLSRANLYSLDLPGHGRSEGEAQTSIAGYTDLLLEFLEALELTQATLVGHSMGGAIAQNFALDHASRVDRLILVGTGARLRVLPSILEGLLNDFESTVNMMLGYAYFDDAPQELVGLARQEWLANPPAVLHGDFLACDNFDAMDRLEEIHCATLVLCGEADQLTPPRYSSLLQERIADAMLSIIPEAGHMVMLEQPGLVNRAIEEFLAKTTA